MSIEEGLVERIEQLVRENAAQAEELDTAWSNYHAAIGERNRRQEDLEKAHAEIERLNDQAATRMLDFHADLMRPLGLDVKPGANDSEAMRSACRAAVAEIERLRKEIERLRDTVAESAAYLGTDSEHGLEDCVTAIHDAASRNGWDSTRYPMWEWVKNALDGIGYMRSAAREMTDVERRALRGEGE